MSRISAVSIHPTPRKAIFMEALKNTHSIGNAFFAITQLRNPSTAVTAMEFRAFHLEGKAAEKFMRDRNRIDLSPDAGVTRSFISVLRNDLAEARREIRLKNALDSLSLGEGIITRTGNKVPASYLNAKNMLSAKIKSNRADSDRRQKAWDEFVDTLPEVGRALRDLNEPALVGDLRDLFARKITLREFLRSAGEGIRSSLRSFFTFPDY